MEAFNALSGDRQIGMGVGPIPFTAIDRYADRFGYSSSEDFSFLFTLIRAMDKTWLEIVERKASK